MIIIFIEQLFNKVKL